MPAVHLESPKTVRCAGCGASFEISARQLRRNRGKPSSCTGCRRPRRRPTDKERAYWLDRFTIAEIVELAEGIWGPRELWLATAQVMNSTLDRTSNRAVAAALETAQRA